ncbi:hypothetical protein [Vibrio xiamenensis]|uniref:hypothetical protein n=1 Tax=Vibrio xiamenensis TaxID=861298 RepID=UPI00115FA53F|nr:hypothetical protein [Vibrio xiamenensis]
MPKVRYHIPEGTYLAWLDFRLYELSDAELDRLIKYDAKVLLDPGHIFGESGQGFQRINVSCPRSILHQALDRITSAFND